jgi:hypothetical protein
MAGEPPATRSAVERAALPPQAPAGWTSRHERVPKLMPAGPGSGNRTERECP